MNLSETEMQKRIKLGLVRDSTPQDDSDEEWDGFDDEEDEEEVDLDVQQEGYVFDKRRRQSIDLSSMNNNYHDLDQVDASGRLGMTAVEEGEEEDTIDGDAEMK